MDLETKINLNSRSFRKDFYKFIISQYNPDTFKVDTIFWINILISIFINFYILISLDF